MVGNSAIRSLLARSLRPSHDNTRKSSLMQLHRRQHRPSSCSRVPTAESMGPYLKNVTRRPLPGYQSREAHLHLLTSSRRRYHNVRWSTLSCRPFSSSSGSSSGGKPNDAVTQYLNENLCKMEISDQQQAEFHQRLLQTLEPVYGKDITVAHLKSFGAAGLEALALSIQQEFSKNQQQAKYVTVHFVIPHHHTEFNLKWYNYDTEPLLSVVERTAEGAELLSEYIERACSGNAMCSTCHVYVKDNSDAAASADGGGVHVTKKSTSEKDMLDLAYEPKRSSRLACQVLLEKVPEDKVNSDEPALTVLIPAGVNNIF